MNDDLIPNSKATSRVSRTDFLSQFTSAKSLLNSIFIEYNGRYLSIIKNHSNSFGIPIFFANNIIDMKEKLILIQELTNLFIQSNWLIPFIQNAFDHFHQSIFEPLIAIYLNIDNQEARNTTYTCLELLSWNINCTKDSLEQIFQSLATVFHNQGNKELTEQRFINHMNLLKIFYMQKDQAKDKKCKSIRNYFYFSGVSNGFLIEIIPTGGEDTSFIKLTNGCYIIFWLWIEKDLNAIKKLQNPQKEIYLFNALFEKSNLKLGLQSSSHLYITLKDTLYNIEDGNELKEDSWNNITIRLTKSSLIILMNNKVIFTIKSSEIKTDCKISQITFGENFIGKVTSIIFFNYDYGEKPPFSNFPYGFCKKKYITNALREYRPDYLIDTMNVKKDKDKEEVDIIDSRKNIEQKHKMMIYTPFAYDSSNRKIEDLCNGPSVLLPKYTGISIFSSHSKDIDMLGGINNLLPLIELMYISKNPKITEQYKLLTSNILNARTFLIFIDIISIIITNKPKNLADVNHNKFFSSLALFIEKFPKEIFNEKILEKLIEIINSEINERDKDSAAKDTDESKTRQHSSFIEKIILNEKIIAKFSPTLQGELWEKMNQLIEKDIKQSNTLFDLFKICIILKYYDSNKELKYCCRNHANLFEKEENDIEKKIIHPELLVRTKHLLKTAEFLITNTKEKNDVLILMKFLALDLSPCLQKEIIEIVRKFFAVKEPNEDEFVRKTLMVKKDKGIIINPKQEILNYILKQNIYELLLYTLSVSLLDVRSIILDLIIQLTKDYPSCFTELVNEQAIIFITRNILPYNLKYEADKTTLQKQENLGYEEIEETNGNSIQMDNYDHLNESIQSIRKDSYIDKEHSNQNHKPLYELMIQSVYKKQVDSMWITLLKRFNEKSDSLNLYSNYILNFLIQLSTTTEAAYIHFLTKTLLEKMKSKNSLFNIKEKYISVRFYDWIIEIIFIYTFNLDIEACEADSKGIVHNGEELLNLMIENQKDDNDNTNKILRVINYAEHFEKTYNKQITAKGKKAIIRNLLLIVLKSDTNFDSKALITFEFILRNNSTLTLDSNTKIDMFNLDKFIISSVDLIMSNKGNSISLESHWEDFELVNIIIDHYISKLSFDDLCKEINANNQLNNFELKLIQEYGFNKKMKNKLLNRLIPLLHLNKKGSLLRIIIFLLSILVHFTHDEEKLHIIADKYQGIILFCILCSINITATDADYEVIQHELSDSIAFGVCYLKLQLNANYEMIINKYIKPIIIHGNTQVEQRNTNSFMQLFTDKKLDITNSAVFQLFKISEQNVDDVEIKDPDTIPFNQFLSLKSYTNLFNDETSKRLKLLNPIIFHNDYNNEIIKQAKKKISKTVKNIIPFFERQLKEHSNGEFLEQKILRHSYKTIKKSLFSWRGLWSHRYIFYDQPGLLKQKMLNHYTTEMCRPILAPIIDFNYYLPIFTKFKVQNLCFKDDYAYKVNLNIDSILDNSQNDENDKDKEKELNSDSTTYLLKGCYTLTYPEIWNNINLAQKNINLEKGLTELETKEILLQDHTQSQVNVNNNQNKNQIIQSSSEKMYRCCIVKQMNHCKGILSLENKLLRFAIITNDIKDPNSLDNGIDHMDRERKTCYGSFITKYPKSKDMFTFSIKYSSIKFFFRRTYFYSKTAIEIYTTNNKSYFINFNSSNDIEAFISDLLSHFNDYNKIQIDWKTIGYQINQKDKNQLITLQNIQTNWAKWKISTMEYLMWLNIFSNRSFIDLTQYPVFPWIISNYTEEINKNSYRELHLPMGMISIHAASKERRDRYKEQYATMKEEYDEVSMNEIESILSNHKPYLFGSHYSNPTYVAHYMTRIFPYANILLEIQGNRFDDPDRLFNSIIRSFECAITQKCDVRELIPEFYYFPEMLLNINNLNLAQIKEGKKDHTVILPKWAKCQFSFIAKQREVLESKIVNSHINDWIDLIFGIYQKGKKADEKSNVFMANTYENVIKLNLVTDREEREALLRLVEMGMTPNQILSDKAITKLEANIYGKAIYESKNLECSTYPINNLRNKRMLKMKLYGNDRLTILQNDTIFTISFNYHEPFDKIVKENKPYSLPNDSNLCSVKHKMQTYYSETQKNLSSPPMLIYFKGLIIAMGGFWDGRIEITYLNIKTSLSEVKYIECDNYSPVVIMEMDKNESMVICGTLLGRVNVYQINQSNWKLQAKLFNHNKEITGISINSTLNVFATTAKDGYIMIYILPSNTLVRSIKLDKKIIGDYIFLSALPLPEVVIYNKKNHSFVCYSINGSLITQLVDKEKVDGKEQLTEMYSPIVFTSPSFVDYVIYGTNIGYLKIRAFPMMTMIRMIGVSVNDIPKPIKMIELSEDSSYCYTYSGEGDHIITVHDSGISVQDVTRLFNEYGFCV